MMASPVDNVEAEVVLESHDTERCLEVLQRAFQPSSPSSLLQIELKRGMPKHILKSDVLEYQDGPVIRLLACANADCTFDLGAEDKLKERLEDKAGVEGISLQSLGFSTLVSHELADSTKVDFAFSYRDNEEYDALTRYRER